MSKKGSPERSTAVNDRIIDDISNYISNEELVFGIYKEALQLIYKKINNPILKLAKDPNRHFSKEDTKMTDKLMKMYSA